MIFESEPQMISIDPSLDVSAEIARRLDGPIQAAQSSQLASSDAELSLAYVNLQSSRFQHARSQTLTPDRRRSKQRSDPEGLSVVHHGVGSEDCRTDGFTRAGPDSARPRLLVPQRDDGIHSRRAQRRHVRRQCGGDDQHDRDNGEGRDVRRADVEEQPSHDARERRGAK
jgi:hypothetical protein